MEVRWQAEIPGEAAVAVLCIDSSSDSVYVSDGWGVAYAALRLRRLSLTDGNELADARLGNQARCVTTSGTELLAATDTKIFRLDPGSLDEVAARWDRRVPRYTDMVCRIGERLVLANWKHDACAVVETEDWRVRRVRPGPYPVLIPAHDQVYVFSRGSGRLLRLDASDERVRLDRVSEGPPGADIAYDDEEDAFYVLEGIPALEVRTASTHAVRPGPPSDVLRHVRKDGDDVRLRLDRPARRIAVDSGRRRLWAIDDMTSTISIYDLPSLDLVARHEIRSDDDTSIVSVAPAAGVVVTATGKPPQSMTTLTCFVTHMPLKHAA